MSSLLRGRSAIAPHEAQGKLPDSQKIDPPWTPDALTVVKSNPLGGWLKFRVCTGFPHERNLSMRHACTRRCFQSSSSSVTLRTAGMPAAGGAASSEVEFLFEDEPQPATLHMPCQAPASCFEPQ